MRTKYLFLAVWALLLASCSIEVDNRLLTPTDEFPVFYATIEDSGAQTKVYADEELRVLWNADDRISIFNLNRGNQQFRFDGKDGANAGSFSYVSGNSSYMLLEHIVAVYPYSEATAITQDGRTAVMLPATQTYMPNSFGRGANTMISVTDDNNLHFRNVCSYLCIKLYGDDIKVKSITLRGNNNEDLAGLGIITMAPGETPVLDMQSTATKSITLTCETPVQLGTTAEEPTPFFMVVPPTVFTKGISVTVLDDKDGIFEINSSVELELTRSYLTKLGAKKVTPDYAYVPIPDPGFRNYCIENFDYDKDGKISFEEALETETIITVSTDTIASLKGIEFFTNLIGLNCSGSAKYNAQVGKTVYLGCLTSLDISKNTALKSLSCNNNKLSSLDVSKNVNLETLQCSSNQLTSLDVSNLLSLEVLSCGLNQLTNLDVSKNTALTELYCSSNLISDLSVNTNTMLKNLDCSTNQLESLDVSHNTALKNLSCGYNQLTSLNLSINTELRLLHCYNNQLNTLDVSNNTSLATLACDHNQLSALNVSNNTALRSFFCGFNQLSTLDVSYNNALFSLDCSNNQLAVLDISNNTALQYLYCFNNQLTSLDMSGNTALSLFQCGNNPLTSVLLPATITEISYGALEGCAFSSIVIPPSVTTIGGMAFNDCKSLTEIDIPESVESIGFCAFQNCVKLNAIRLTRSVPPTGETMMFNNTNSCPIYVPAGSVDAYKAAQYWSDYAARISAPLVYNEPEIVDLGLPSGTKWASFNLGASAPEEAGYYYAWGETEPKGNYDWPSYKWCNLYITNLLKYNASNNNGVVDDKTTLDLADDAAHVILGSSWRMPTRNEALELESYCTWTWTTLEGVPGYLIVSKQNGNSIFLPAAGYKSYKSVSYSQTFGYYWTSTLDSDCNKAKEIFISSSSNGWGTSWRSWGMPIRPVYGERVEVTGITMNSPSETIQLFSFLPLSATLTPANASDQGIIWTSSDETIAKVSSNGDVQGIGVGTATIKASANGFSAKCTITVTPVSYETPDAVDLGLPSGLLWGSLNLGAKTPVERGLYFSWGEVEPKASFDWENYKWYDQNSSSFTKYTDADQLTTLESEDDAAHVILGDGWRMPTQEEVEELQNSDYCTWTWKTIGGVNGYLIVSKQNGNSIFLATSGYIIDNNLYNANDYGLYWTSSLYSSDKAQGVELYFRSADNIFSSNYNRTGGQNIRPVHEPVNP